MRTAYLRPTRIRSRNVQSHPNPKPKSAEFAFSVRSFGFTFGSTAAREQDDGASFEMPSILVHPVHGLQCVPHSEDALEAFARRFDVPRKNLNQLVGLKDGPRGKVRGAANGWRRVEDVQWLRRSGHDEIVPILWPKVDDFITHVAKKRTDTALCPSSPRTAVTSCSVY